MGVATQWGYSVEFMPLDPLVEVATLATVRGVPETDAAEAAAEAASGAVRDYCGWHVAPPIVCEAEPRVAGQVAVLPSNCVTDVTRVTERGVALEEGTDYEWRRNGLMRRIGRNWDGGWGAVSVSFVSGYELDAVPSVVSIAADLACEAAATPVGVSSETAGNISVSYDRMVAGGMSSPRIASVLSRYRIVRGEL